ncbi:MAG TPA: sigma-70 family RNA polymerase sigma factor [Burkholderiaceae bacterium]|nr:sigma-70 family RNA polymerase sigma factor [Burkholderiaceae bacterium]
MSMAPREPAPGELAPWLAALRPKLHRYCARMTGSVFDGEDAVQDTLLKALESFPGFDALDHPQAWLFRVAHNAVMDLLRARARHAASAEEGEMDDIVDPATPLEDRFAAGAALGAFMQLAPSQRSSVILMDVLGYSLQEVCSITDRTLPAVKATLHRGRSRLRELGSEALATERRAATLSSADRALLANYIERFNARDFDAVRDMLADEVRLDLVARTRMTGKAQVGNYLHNYAQARDWRLILGAVEGRAAAVVCSPDAEIARPMYCMLLRWRTERLEEIRDFRYARYVLDGADLQLFGQVALR